jgi:Ger(x)C family germination protein
VEGNKSSGDYIDHLIRHLSTFNFFSENYKMIDVLIRAESEGRSLVLPYIEVKDGKLKATGMALFSKDKLVKSIGLEEARVMNLLRESNVQGIIQIKKSTKSYFSLYGTSKRTVNCRIADDKFVFDIKLKIKGTVAANSMYKNLVKDPELKKTIEKDLKMEVEKLSYDFIEKMKKDYKVDCLELGRCAVEKYGRRKNADWDKVVCESQINVTADVKIVDIGRGDL